MRKLTVIIALLGMFFLCACGGDQPDEKTNDNAETKTEVETKSETDTEPKSDVNIEEKYSIESGFIEYEVLTMGIKTKVEIYFEDHGKKEAILTTTAIMGMETIMRVLMQDSIVYSFNDIEKTGTKTSGLGDFSMQNIDFSNLENLEADGVKIKKTGNVDFLGKSCQAFIVEHDGNRADFTVWNNIPVKMITEASGIKIKMIAKKIEENPTMPDGIFEIPEGYKITEMDMDDLDKTMEKVIEGNK